MLIPWRMTQDVTPWREMERLGERMRALLDPDVAREGMIGAQGMWPAVELVEEDDEFVLSAELPGIPMEDVEISVQDDVLSITGEKRSERDEQRGRTHFRERTFGSFERSFALPPSVKTAEIRAECKDGLLRIHMPKGEESHGRRIEIQS